MDKDSCSPVCSASSSDDLVTQNIKEQNKRQFYLKKRLGRFGFICLTFLRGDKNNEI